MSGIYFTFAPEGVEVVLIQRLVQNDQTDLVCPFVNIMKGQRLDYYAFTMLNNSVPATTPILTRFCNNLMAHIPKMSVFFIKPHPQDCKCNSCYKVSSQAAQTLFISPPQCFLSPCTNSKIHFPPSDSQPPCS